MPRAKRVLKALRQVEQQEFPALLLRIDSPGGTVGDSQEIHQALMRLREKGCKVVASYGNIFASGGVYVGSAAERVVANAGDHRLHRRHPAGQQPRETAGARGCAL